MKTSVIYYAIENETIMKG